MNASNPLLDLQSAAGPAVPARPSAALVNRDAAVRVSLKFLFEAAGFGVRAFASGRGLMASSAGRAADCFVLDHAPRAPDGLHLARRLRARGLRAPILLTTDFPCSALEVLVGAIERVILAPTIDDALIRRLLEMIETDRRLRKTT